jgi:hypothetical protein
MVVIFFQRSYGEYQANYKDLPEDIKVETIEYVRWQKDRHKLERDLYLCLSSILAQALLLTASHWIDKYYSYLDYVERKSKAE